MTLGPKSRFRAWACLTLLPALALTFSARLARAGEGCPEPCPPGYVCTPDGTCVVSPFAEPEPEPVLPAPTPEPVPVLVVEDQTQFQGDEPAALALGTVSARLHAGALGVLPPLGGGDGVDDPGTVVLLVGAGFVLDGSYQVSPRLGLGVHAMLGRQIVLAEGQTLRGSWSQLGLLLRIQRRARRRTQVFGDIVPSFHGTVGRQGDLHAAGFGLRGAIGLRTPGVRGAAFIGTLSVFLPVVTRMSFEGVREGRSAAYTVALPVFGVSAGLALSG